MKQVWRLALTHLRNWKVPYKDQEWTLVNKFMDLLLTRLREPLRLQNG